MTEKDGYFEILDGFPADVIAVSAHGHIGREDYEDKLIPFVEGVIGKEGKVRLLYVVGPDFEGFSAGAAWDDAKLGLMHLGDFTRVAVVTDIDWIRMGMKMFAPMMRGPVRVFAYSDLDKAKDWIAAPDDAHDDHQMDVAADHKIPPLEDKGPIR